MGSCRRTREGGRAGRLGPSGRDGAHPRPPHRLQQTPILGPRHPTILVRGPRQCRALDIMTWPEMVQGLGGGSARHLLDRRKGGWHPPLLLYFPFGAYSGPHERRLLHDLMDQYNKLERPAVNESDAVVLTFGLALQQIIDVDEKNQLLTTNVWLNLVSISHSTFDLEIHSELEKFTRFKRKKP